MESISPSPADQSKGRWIAIWRFLNRDIRTFFPGNRKKGQPNDQAPPPTDDQSPASRVDVAALDRTLYRRQILNWRDKHLVALRRCGRDCLSDFIGDINKKLAEISLLRRLFPHRANEELSNVFSKRVTLKLMRQVKVAAEELKDLKNKIGASDTLIESLAGIKFDRDLDCIHEFAFTKSNRTAICDRIERLVMQDIVGSYQSKITAISNVLTDRI